jgi:hypothetical protein
MAWVVMILMRENPFLGPLEGRGWALENETFLGPEMALYRTIEKSI